ncbi:MAG TPA: error-prone DNA polymerase [Planctomycetota bacterium]|jgi:error-prone DNA polymerase
MYAELHCRTNFSFLEGASFPDELVQRAAALGLSALAVTDRNSLCGIVRAHTAAKEAGIKLIIGAEITPTDGLPLLLYPTDRDAYGRLCRLISTGRRRAGKGECLLTVADIAAHAAGMMAVAILDFGFWILDCGQLQTGMVSALRGYREMFGERLSLAAELHLGADDGAQFGRLQELARECGVPLVAANDVHYHDAGRQALQDILVCIRHGCMIDQAGGKLFPNTERRLKSEQEMRLVLANAAAASCGAAEAERIADALLARSVEIASACQFSLDQLRYDYPEELAPAGKTPIQWLTELSWRGAQARWPNGVPEKVRGQIEHELRLIEELHYEAYFLTVWDIVKFARSRDILCQGRGSAANSAVCFCLGITSVDPARTEVLFERFVSRERAEAPDIDVDFEHERREEVLQYVYQKYGRERAGIVAEVISYRPKSAVRDVGKALGLSLDAVDRLAGEMDFLDDSAKMPQRVRAVGLDPNDRRMRLLVGLCRELLGFPRHLSQHVGGFVISGRPLCELVPIENAAMADRTVIEWDKDDIDALGILKVDCLALGMLTAIHKCLNLVNAQLKIKNSKLKINSEVREAGRQSEIRNPQSAIGELTLATIPAEDPKVYEMCCHADTVGVFQIESRAQMAMLPRLKPRCFYDLVVEVSIVRPGPIQGGMVHPYLKRRAGEEVPNYPNDAIRAVLEKTMGVPLFQEQVMRLAMVAANFTPGEADQLRRAMGAWRRPGLIGKLREKMLAGMLKNGIPPQYAENIFDMIRGFGEYGFPESHAASFALLVYASAWLKLYYPAHFTTSLLNSQPMGFYAPAQLVRDAQNHGVTVLPADVNHSLWDCTLVGEKELRLGFRMIRGLSRLKHVEAVLKARDELKIKNSKLKINGEVTGDECRVTGDSAESAQTRNPQSAIRNRFTSIADFARRTQLSKAVLARLAAADAFQSLGVDRRTALWQVLAQHEELPLFQWLEVDEPSPALTETPMDEHIVQDYESTGLSLKAHPISLLREELTAAGILSCAQLPSLKDGAFVKVAGLVLVRQRPDVASGVVFMTIEDESGQANLIVWPKVFERFRKVGRTSTAVVVEGRLQRQGELTHLVVQRLRDLSESLPQIGWRSRDFH